MTVHENWVRQITAELDGDLTLQESAGLARHLAGCGACAGARVSQLELRLALVRSTGHENPRTPPRPRALRRTVALWLTLTVAAATAGGWVAHARWGQGWGSLARGPLESSRAVFVVQ